MNSNKLLFWSCILIFLAYLGKYYTTRPEGDIRKDPFDKPYSVKILNDHQVQLASKSDTLILFLENSATFNDEYVIFIKAK